MPGPASSRGISTQNDVIRVLGLKHRDGIKEHLQYRGGDVWNRYKQVYDTYKRAGHSGPEYMTKALFEVVPDFPGIENLKPYYEMVMNSSPGETPAKPTSRAGASPRVIAAAKRAEEQEEEFDPSIFDGKMCSERDSVVFAAERCELPGWIAPTEFPSLYSYSIYKAHREHKTDLWKDHMPKFYPTRSQLDAERGKNAGSDHLLSLIDRAKREFRERHGRDYKGDATR